MATFTRPDSFATNLGTKIFTFASDTFRWLLTNTAPTAAATLLATNVTQIATGGGYTQWVDGGATGFAATVSGAQSTAAYVISHTSSTFTATGAVGTFRYPVLIDDTPTSPANPVVGWLDHGAGITMATTDTYNIPTGTLYTVG